jgi:hypothetical protein
MEIYQCYKYLKSNKKFYFTRFTNFSKIYKKKRAGSKMDIPIDNSPIDCAIKGTHVSVVEYLVQKVKTMENISSDGVTPLERFISNPILCTK